VLDWLKYCVLEDQLERMHSSALAAASASAAAASQELKRELEEIGREWEVHVHPE
jgi:hypothetical protein